MVYVTQINMVTVYVEMVYVTQIYMNWIEYYSCLYPD